MRYIADNATRELKMQVTNQIRNQKESLTFLLMLQKVLLWLFYNLFLMIPITPWAMRSSAANDLFCGLITFSTPTSDKTSDLAPFRHCATLT